MPLTDNMYTLSKWSEALLETNKGSLGLKDVFYGDQDRIPRTPAVCVEPGEKRRDLNGAPRRTEVTIVIYFILYHNPLKGMEVVRDETDKLAEEIETLFHADAQMDSQVIDSMVTQIESGFMQKSNTMFRASRLTLEARSQVQLPSSV